MDASTPKLKTRSCGRCGFFGDTVDTICPKCRGTLVTTASTRIRGFLMVLCGAFLLVFVGYLFIWVMAAFANTDPSKAKFTGTERERLMIIGLFSLLMLFGLVSAGTGGYQLLSGRRSRTLTFIVIGISLLLAIAVGFIIFTFG